MSAGAALRSLLAALPAVEEREHMGSASFRVDGKIFAQLDLAETTVLVKMPLSEQAARLQADPTRFWLPDHWGKFGWTYVRLEGTPLNELRELLQASWLAVAPKSLSARQRHTLRAK